MGLLSGSMESLSLKGRRSSNASQGPSGEEPEGNANDTSQLDKEEGNVLMTIIGQCERLVHLCIRDRDETLCWPEILGRERSPRIAMAAPASCSGLME